MIKRRFNIDWLNYGLHHDHKKVQISSPPPPSSSSSSLNFLVLRSCSVHEMNEY